MIILQKITDALIEQMLERHASNGGVLMDESLSKLFECMEDEKNLDEVKIKVAALNTLYSTAIQNIQPVAKKITDVCSKTSVYESEKMYVDLIDKIARVEWSNKNNTEKYIRHNLSFASKYVHFLSKYQTPIYDSYIWIVMVGYLLQSNNEKVYAFNPPSTYAEFYKIFNDFKTTYGLHNRTNYDIDKFLWQYGKLLIDQIQVPNNNNPSLEQRKTSLKKQLLK